ncbi:MAG: hypothetical protein CVT48_06485 [Thermoplasmata archaeon HGW-Thermoplasmata-1]|nr:MAG: hypothetical protein CVT48_06485 [Thermoplasmata archaeon HGW-Thermoplasmata-1]
MLEVLQYQFMQNALIAGLLASVACGVIGSYVVVKRMVFIAGGISHASFGGIGLGYLLGMDPIIGALAFTVLSALGMGAVHLRTRQSEDTLIGAMWAIGMAAGLVFIALSPGYAPDLMSYLFGNILTVSRQSILLVLALDALVVAAVALFYKGFFALTFDEEYAKVSGIKTTPLYLLLLTLIAITAVVLIKVVGIIMVIALMTLPAAIARKFTYRLSSMMALATALGAVFVVSGIALSYVADLPTGATIVLVGGVAYVVSFLAGNGMKKARKKRIVKREC